MGKTTLLNAINWCLYDEEPHSAESSNKLPLLNLNCIDESEINEKHNVTVELRVSTEDGRNVTFKRTQNFKIHQNKVPVPQSNDFKVYHTDNRGNTKIIKDLMLKCGRKLCSFSNKRIFFFDGERLDNYFKEVRSKCETRFYFITYPYFRVWKNG